MKTSAELRVVFGIALLAWLAACSNDNGASPQPAGAKSGVIANNHGHEARLTASQLEQGGDLTLDIQGGAGHAHTVQLSGEDLSRVREGQVVARQSSTTNGHSHLVTFN